ncbi:PP0621 family protein [Leptospira sp. 96542]|nr:PP0621 family protein [Leptospira sp. 96542]
MKFLLFLLIILLAVWLWRSGRTAETPPKRTTGGPTRASARDTAPQDMVRCAHCGLHLPLSEAVASTSAHYCSAEHRQLAEPGTY